MSLKECKEYMKQKTVQAEMPSVNTS